MHQFNHSIVKVWNHWSWCRSSLKFVLVSSSVLVLVMISSCVVFFLVMASNAWVGMCGWQKWLRFDFAKNCSFWFGFGFTKLTVVLVFFWFDFFALLCCLMCMHSTEYSWADFKLHLSVDAIFHLHLYGITLKMMYFRAELVQLIVSGSDSELEL